jgi:hypothetical protein
MSKIRFCYGARIIYMLYKMSVTILYPSTEIFGGSIFIWQLYVSKLIIICFNLFVLENIILGLVV